MSNPAVSLKGTTVEIDGDVWTVILMPIPLDDLPQSKPGGPRFDAATLFQLLCGMNLAIATRGVDGKYVFSVPPYLANRIRSKIGPDFVWETLRIPPASAL
jgi:hypothetical protein